MERQHCNDSKAMVFVTIVLKRDSIGSVTTSGKTAFISDPNLTSASSSIILVLEQSNLPNWTSFKTETLHNLNNTLAACIISIINPPTLDL